VIIDAVVLETTYLTGSGVRSPWEYMHGAYSRATPGMAVTLTPTAFGAAGMAGWGATCGIAISCAVVTEIATTRGLTNARIDEIFAHFCEDPHPFVDVGNAGWFLNHTAKVAVGGSVRRQSVTGFTPRSLQCHNIVEQYRNPANGYLAQLGTGLTPDLLRSELCGRLVADNVVRTLQQINNLKHGTATPTRAFSTRRVACGACHDALDVGANVMPKEDCTVCHR